MMTEKVLGAGCSPLQRFLFACFNLFLLSSFVISPCCEMSFAVSLISVNTA